jgi:5-methylcytosine-specific restriction endonuclease McrA
MMFPKAGVVRLVGKALAALNDRIWHRDGGCCVLCGAPVPYGTKFHHIRFKSQGGGDTEQNGATLCQTGNNCHGQAHGPKAKEIRAKLLAYIRRIYDISA